MSPIPHRDPLPRPALICLLMASLYLCLGLALGLGMAASHDFQLRPVHTHINLLGWASLGLTGLIYAVMPSLTQRVLCTAHLWLHGLGLPVMMVALAALNLGFEDSEPLVVVGSLAVTGGVLCFTMNLFQSSRHAG
ncbi:MAG: cytochrome-c oxidase [Rhodospirillum sp.]|nr:cytochrome-c oxidase [Rhodospirillum sp.]MCF8488056.1 cytochrome-c oxidase [Rhodospirillum sp.]MCF8501540.1 cytochrome-c oxidase [Rhodospirillum sp.]